MQQEELKQLCIEACAIVREVGLFLKTELGKVNANDIEVKSLNSLVSYVDKTAEEKLVKGLQGLLPQSVFLTEEETIINQSGDLQWIIDPLDGTTNFLHQLPFFSISVALRQQEQLVIGIVLEVNREECFYAWKGGGAWLNSKQIHVKENANLSDALLATGFPYYDYQHTQAYLKVLESFMRNTRGIRRFGSAALDLAYTACGRFDAFFEYSLHAWDVAGGIILVQEAGGTISDFNGGEDYLFGKEIIASSTQLHPSILKTIQKEFYSPKSTK